MSRSKFLRILSLMPLLGAGCSRQTRVSNAINQSEFHSEQAIENILEGDISDSKLLAGEALKFASAAQKSAQRLKLNHPYRSKAETILEKAKIIAETFENAEGSLEMWWYALGSGNTNLAKTFFDTSYIIDTMLEGIEVTPQQKEELTDAFNTSLDSMYGSFKDTVGTLDLAVNHTVPKKNETLGS